MANYNDNSTNYEHSFEPNTTQLTMAMDYNNAGEPVIRVKSFLGSTTDSNFTGAALDAFGRVRVSQPLTLFDSTNLTDNIYRYDYSATGTANSYWDSTKSERVLTVGTDTGDRILTQTRRRMSYQPGKSLLWMSTFILGEAKENVRRREGYYDDNNGIFLEQTNDGIYMVRRSDTSGSVVEERIEQADWNGDKLNGVPSDNPSGHVLDLSKSQILWADLEWLGVGTVRIGFIINGQFIICHSFHHSNEGVGVYMKTPNLPIRSEMDNTGPTASASEMSQICLTVISEGGYEPRGVEHVYGTSDISNPVTLPNTANTWTNLVTIKLRDINRVIVPSGVDILNINNADAEWGLFVNATPTTAFTFTNETDAVAASVQDRQFTDLGRRVSGGYLAGKASPIAIGAADGGFNWEYQIGSDIAGNSDTLTLAVRSASGNSDMAGLLKWVELH